MLSNISALFVPGFSRTSLFPASSNTTVEPGWKPMAFLKTLGKEMIYLDSNVFIYAATSTSKKGQRSRLLISNITQGKEKAATASLTFDEVMWAVKR